MQQTWNHGVEWDTPLSEDITQQWNQLCELARDQEFAIPRHVHFSGSEKLHVFSDASSRAYASCVYLTGEESYLLLSRNRIVNQKSKLTIPRLELQGAVLAALMIDEVISPIAHHGEVEIHAWVDNMCVLQWNSASPSRLPTYVANRLSQLQ